jgi:IS30 family transposase
MKWKPRARVLPSSCNIHKEKPSSSSALKTKSLKQKAQQKDDMDTKLISTILSSRLKSNEENKSETPTGLQIGDIQLRVFSSSIYGLVQWKESTKFRTRT